MSELWLERSWADKEAGSMTERPWGKLIPIGIPIAWIWFALLGVRWDVFYALFIAIALTIILGTVTSIMESPKNKDK